MKRHTFTTAFSALLFGAAFISCSKDTTEPPVPGDRMEIAPTVQVAAADGDAENSAVSKGVEDGATALTLQFLRADETAAGTYGAYVATVLPATRTAGSGATALAFATKQYYLVSGLKTKMTGWYPAATSFTSGIVSWTINGTQDILTAPKQEGSYKGAMPGFTFGHRLTQLQFYPYYSNAEAATVWGKVSAVKVLNQRTACTFTPASADATGAVAFTGAVTSTLAVTGGSAMTPGLGTAAAAQFGQPVMIEPQEGSYELTVVVTTEKGDLTMKVPARTYPAGVATKVYLKFTAYGLIGDATIADWAAAEDEEVDMSASGYVPCWYGDAVQNGSNVTGLGGSFDKTYNKYTETANGTAYTDAATAYTGEKPYYQLQVAAADEVVNGKTTMTWSQAWQACKNKVTDGGGWRMPRLSELALLWNNRATLAAQNGFTAFSSTQYWSGTDNVAGTSDWVLSLTGSSVSPAGAAKTTASYGVRCVRESFPAPFVGQYRPQDGGVVFWVDPNDAKHYKVMAMTTTTGGNSRWASQITYVPSAPNGENDGASNQKYAKAYSEDTAANGTTGVFATDFPAFASCYNRTDGNAQAGEWFLPANQELWVIYRLKDSMNPVLSANGGVTIGNYRNITSTQYSATQIRVIDEGSNKRMDKTWDGTVRCIRDFQR